jgi:hypothetical protein
LCVLEIRHTLPISTSEYCAGIIIVKIAFHSGDVFNNYGSCTNRALNEYKAKDLEKDKRFL